LHILLTPHASVPYRKLFFLLSVCQSYLLTSCVPLSICSTLILSLSDIGAYKLGYKVATWRWFECELCDDIESQQLCTTPVQHIYTYYIKIQHNSYIHFFTQHVVWLDCFSFKV
jgi:hypothetical protein